MIRSEVRGLIWRPKLGFDAKEFRIPGISSGTAGIRESKIFDSKV